MEIYDVHVLYAESNRNLQCLKILLFSFISHIRGEIMLCISVLQLAHHVTSQVK